jgi:sugar phosphate isomerase/epimerase
MKPPLFSCQEQLIPGDTYTEKWEFLTRTGFSGIEIWSNHLLEHFDELVGLCSSTGIRVSSGCQSFEGGLINSNEQARQSAINSTVEGIRALAAMNGSGYVLPAGFALGSFVLPPYRAPRSPAEDERALVEALHQILEETTEIGVAVFLEPINRYETHFLHTLAEAERIVSAVHHPSLGITADFFHMSIEEANPARSICQSGPWIKHIHLADSNRKFPGQGHLDFVDLFSALQQAGYSGWMTIECDTPADAKVELPIAFQYLDGCWQQAVERIAN